MKLKSIILRNFRAYLVETRIPVGDFVAFIGKNDVGKSTILDALAIFFENPLGKIDIEDLSKRATSREIMIGCEFEVGPEELVIDATARTSLADEYLLNESRCLEIQRCFDFNTKTPKKAVYAVAMHPSAPGVADLLSLKNDQLKGRVQDAGIRDSDVKLNSNPSLRKALWRNTPDLQVRLQQISLNEEDGKKTWDKIAERLPVFALFRADRPSTDEDAEVQDPMKLAVAEAVQSVQNQLEQIRTEVEKQAMDVARRTLSKLQRLDPSLAAELTPRFKSEPKWDGFKLSLTGDEEIPINKRGSGVRRLVLLSFFQAEVERRRLQQAAPGAIYAIEEPEASQHPNNQRMVAEALLRMSETDGCQVLITTHVPGLANLLPIESLRYVFRDNLGRVQISNGTEEGTARLIAESLGSLPAKDVTVLVYVEGPNDVNFLHNVSRTIAARDTSTLSLAEDPRVVVFPTGGHNLWQWLNADYFSKLNCTEVHIYDRGTATPAKYQNEMDEINRRGDRDCCFLTKKREAENYLHPAAVGRQTGIEPPSFSDLDDVPEIVAKALHDRDTSPEKRPWEALSEDQVDDKKKRIKRRLNDEVAAAMTYEEIVEMDREGEISTWLREIRSRMD